MNMREWMVTSQLGYALKAYGYLPVTWVKRVLFGKEKRLKEYFRNCWGILPTELLEESLRRPVIWIEAQSMGEVGQMISFCHELKQHFPEYALMLSTHDESSLQLARKQLPLSGSFYSPWDIPWVCRRLVRLLRPRLLLYVEHVKSPVLLEEAHRSGVSTVLISGFFPVGWEHNAYLRRPIARRFWEFLDVVGVKEKEDLDHLRSFGTDPSRISVRGDLKFDRVPLWVDEEKKERLKREFRLKEEPILIGGSLHASESDFVAQAFLLARRSVGNLKLILAPRWLKEVEEIESIVSKYPFRIQRRSALSDAGWEDILMLDSYGELASLYSLATVVFMGGSLPERNHAWSGLCHNMIEPILHHKPVFFGTNTHYRRRIVEQLKETWPRLEVTTPSELGEGIVCLIRDLAIREKVVAREREIASGQSDVVSKYVSLVGDLLVSTERRPGSRAFSKKMELVEANS